MKRYPESERASRGLLGLLLLVGVVVSVGALRWRLLDVPLERDEGEYAYAAQMLLQGEPPYSSAYTMKLPGTIAAYAAILAFGDESPRAIRAGLLVVNALTTVLVYGVARRLFATAGAITAAGVFGLLSLSHGLRGFTANAEHFVILPVVAALLCLLRARERDRSSLLAGAGFLLGVAFLMKQHAALFVAFAAVWTVLDARGSQAAPWRRVIARLAILLGGALVPLLLAVAALAAAGAFELFWFWTVTYARSYVGQHRLADGLGLLWLQVTSNAAIFTGLWLLAVSGLATLASRRASMRSRFLGFFMLFSFAAVCPGLYFRSHYFLLLVPAAALLAGAAIDAAHGGLRARMGLLASRAVIAVAVSLVFASALVQERGYLFRQSPGEILRDAYGQQGFEESLAVAAYLRERTAPDERIGVLGSEPQIYFYAGRRAVTRFVYMYPLFEAQPFADRMQRELLEDFEAAKPRYVVVTANHRSWLPRAGAPQLILDWVPEFLDRDYERVGFTEIAPDGSPIYVFGAEARVREPADASGLQVFQRRP